MPASLSLAHLTVIGLSPPEVVHVAARTGYDAEGLRLLRVTDSSPGYPLMDNPAMLRATLQAMRDTSIRVQDIEFVKITPEIDVAALEPMLAAGEKLGAKHVICAPYDPDLSRLADRLGAIDALAGRYGLHALFEFFPWTMVPNLELALHVVEASGCENVGILVDMLHFNRSNSRLDQLAKVPRQRLPFAHLCDAPAHVNYSRAELLHAGRAERLSPSKGAIDLAAILAQMPANLPLGIEVPMSAKTATDGIEAVALHARQAASRFLAKLGGEG